MGRLFLIALCLAGCGFQHGMLAGDARSPGDAAITDEQPADARPFDPATDCPASYTLTLAGSTSRYRIVQTIELAWSQYALCNADLPDRTHAIVFGSMQEITALTAAAAVAGTTTRFFVGGVQSPTATARDADWITFAGDPLLQTAWHTPENEPNDGNQNLMEDQGEQLLIIDTTLTYLHDAAGATAYGVACECDGVPIHPTAKMYFDLDPNNPN